MNRFPCPLYQCSVSCGKGIQVRNVECVLTKRGALSAHCDPHTKPTAMQSCTTGISCNEYDVGGCFLSAEEWAINNLYSSFSRSQLKQHAARGGDTDDHDVDEDEMEFDEPYAEPRTLALSERQEMRPRTERLVSESQHRIPNEAT